MELFIGNIDGGAATLIDEEAAHCVRVLRHRVGDVINIIDGHGLMCECKILSATSSRVEASVLASYPFWNSHPYVLTIGVCPTKNADRFENFVDKATEFAVDRIVPLIGEHSERRTFKADRCRRIASSAAKQSLKAAVPEVCEPMSVSEFLKQSRGGLKMIACCFEDVAHPREDIGELLLKHPGTAAGACIPVAGTGPAGGTCLAVAGTGPAGCVSGSLLDSEIASAAGTAVALPEITVLIGPEGDFSTEEVKLALDCGYLPVSLGPSRLRTETAAIYCAAAAYGIYNA